MAVSAKISSVLLLIVLVGTGCTTIDPGPNFTITDEQFDADYYYCHIEPELIVAKKCGPGDPLKGDTSCHYSASVSGMPLLDHPLVDCGGGDHPLNRTQTAGAAASDLQNVSFEMSREYLTAPLFVRPSGSNHPRAIFDQNDAQVRMLLSTWANK